MEKFELHILGCGSALPTLRHNPTSQILNVHDKLFMIDCGEGTQLQMRRTRLSFSRLNRIFISHLHGDHCFGLIGLISTYALLGRTATLHIHAPADLEQLLTPWLAYHCRGAAFAVEFHAFPTDVAMTIYEDKSVEVKTVPLRHRVPCCGFVFREQPRLPHIRRDMIDYLGIPTYAINRIKLGGDWQKEDGTVISHDQLVKPADQPRSYAYLSDTAFCPSNVPHVEGVDLMFHEATFAETDATRAAETFHSTAAQAGKMALLAHAKQLLIGHYSSRYDDEKCLLRECQAIFANTVPAQEGSCIAIPCRVPEQAPNLPIQD